MTKAVWGSVFTAAAILVCASPVSAQPATHGATVNVSAEVKAKAKLTLSGLTATFSDADPDTFTTVSAAAITVDVKARTTASGNVTLTVLANHDLINADAVTIPINQLTWDATGALAAGTMSATTAQSLGTWTGGGTQTGTQTYKLVNSWDYKTGTYTAAITYTLTAP